VDICSRGPIRAAIAPDRAERDSITSVMGSIAVPAATGEKPETTCSWTTSSRKTAPKPP